MTRKDPLAAIVSLLLVGSILFLLSGLAAWFLRSGDAPGDRATTASADRLTGDPAAVPASVDADTPRDGVMTSERFAEGVKRVPELASELPPGLLIEGRVLDAAGQPIGDAAVSLELRLDARPAELTEGGARSVMTAADGRFAFLGDAPLDFDASISLVAHAAGHAPQLVQHSVESGASLLDVGDIQLLTGGSIAGQIQDSLGHPVLRATVALQPVSGNLLARWGDRSAILKPASADAAGFYEFPSLTPGAYRVTASAPGMQEGRLRDPALVEDGRDIEVGPIVLAPGFELTGIVLGSGDAAVPGAQVRIRGSASGARFDQSIATGADGRFRVEHLPPGRLQIEARAAGFSSAPSVELDAAASRELVLRLGSGLRVSGIVVDASSGAPVERFAARIRAIGASDRSAAGAAARVLRRRIQTLRDDRAGADDPAVRARNERAAVELEARLIATEGNLLGGRPRRAPADVSSITEHPHGRFDFSGLDEEIYAVDIASAGHQFTSIAPIDVRRDAPVPALRVELVPGICVSGVVVAKADGAPIPGATVELVWVDDAAAGAPKDGGREGTGSPFTWAFATPGAHGDVIMSAKSDDRGRFELRQAPRGRYFLSVSHEQACRRKTEPFDLRSDRDDFRILLAATASLRGRVRGIPDGLERDIAVLAVGGFGTLRTVNVSADCTYRIERLQPGSYVVRAVRSDTSDALDRQVTAIFDHEREATPPDFTLTEGERREFDVTLDLPAVGAVEGSLLINGQPAPGFQVGLRSAPGVAVAARVSRRSNPDHRGRFALREVSPGDYTLQVFSTSSRQELHRQAITVKADASTWVDASISVGGLRGRIAPGDDSPAGGAEGLDGTLTILPGATVAPAQLRQYGQTHPVHTVRIRGGVFQVEHLTPGAALVIVEIRGREPIETTIEIPVRTTLDVVLPAGKTR